MEWRGEAATSRNVTERGFAVDVDGERVPGILWTPEDASGARPLVLIGHGRSQHKRSPNVLALGRRVVRHLGYAAAAIDAPIHGDRDGNGQDLTRELLRRARNEWRATLDELQTLDEIGVGPVGYWGLSMGTIIGLPLVASEPRIDAAVLGLMGIPADAQPRSVASIDVPVLFLVQWDDELAPRENAFTLFERLGTKRKTMHVNPGLHSAVPADEILASERFFEKYLTAEN